MRAWLLFLFLVQIGMAQETPTIVHTVKSDSLYLFLLDNPRVGTGFHVERKGPKDEDFVRLTAEPVEAQMNPVNARYILGSDFAILKQALKVNTPEQMLVKLRADRFSSTVYTMLYHNVGKLLGRFYRSDGHVAGETYLYRIVFVSLDNGDEIDRIEKTIRIVEQPPPPPQEITCEQTIDGVEIKWSYPRWRPGTNDLAVQFRVYRQEKSQAPVKINDKILLRLDGSAYQLIDENINIGHTYTYTMTALDPAEVESEFSIPVSVTIDDIIAPAPPAGLTAYKEGKAIALVWNMSPELDVEFYNLYRWSGLEADSVRLNSTPIPYTETHYIDSTVTFGEQYFYAVSAVDTAKNSSKHSIRVSIFPTDITPPEKIQNLRLTQKNHSVILDWEAPASREPIGYKVGRRVTEGSFAFITPEPIFETRYIDNNDERGLEAGRHYVYQVVAVDSMMLQSEPVEIEVTIPDDESPTPPGMASVQNIAGRELQIVWNPSSALDAAYYHISRISAADTIVFEPIAHPQTELVDAKVKKGTVYRYTIAAEDTAGNRSKAVSTNSITMRDYTAPPRVRFVSANKETNRIKIQWEPVVDFDLAGYYVYRSSLPTGRYERLNDEPVTNTTYMYSAKEEESWYTVRAVDTSGNESKSSEPVHAAR